MSTGHWTRVMGSYGSPAVLGDQLLVTFADEDHETAVYPARRAATVLATFRDEHGTSYHGRSEVLRALSHDLP